MARLSLALEKEGFLFGPVLARFYFGPLVAQFLLGQVRPIAKKNQKNIFKKICDFLTYFSVHFD
jgi:hypothetical protein